MATLTKGMSYRRQGSSGLIWADKLIVREDGAFVAMRREDRGNAGCPSYMQSEATDAIAGGGAGGSMMMMMAVGRSKSVESSVAPSITSSLQPPPSRQKSSFRLMKWLRKAFNKIRG